MIKTRDLNNLISRTLREDAARDDITTNALIPAAHVSEGRIIVKEDAVLCGLGIARKVFQQLDQHVHFQTRFRDGMKVKRHTDIATLKGKTRALLAGERTALNFLGYLCGIATLTHCFVQNTRRSKAKIFDTRKTAPGLRMLARYAVHCGGGFNHRFDLSELVLIKDNHREACHSLYSISRSIQRIKRKTRKSIEIEVDNLDQFQQALAANPDMILLDNMPRAQIKKAVAMARKKPRNKRPLLEASGGITLKNVSAIAKTGIDRIAVGALTHSPKAIDLSMEVVSR